MKEDELIDRMDDHNSPDGEPLHTGLTILSFCIPLAGAIIYFSNKNTAPLKAKTACTAALWGIGVNIVLNILVALAGGGM